METTTERKTNMNQVLTENERVTLPVMSDDKLTQLVMAGDLPLASDNPHVSIVSNGDATMLFVPSENLVKAVLHDVETNFRAFRFAKFFTSETAPLDLGILTSDYSNTLLETLDSLDPDSIGAVIEKSIKAHYGSLTSMFIHDGELEERKLVYHILHGWFNLYGYDEIKVYNDDKSIKGYAYVTITDYNKRTNGNVETALTDEYASFKHLVTKTHKHVPLKTAFVSMYRNEHTVILIPETVYGSGKLSTLKGDNGAGLQLLDNYELHDDSVKQTGQNLPYLEFFRV